MDFSRMLLLTPSVSFTSKFFTPLFIKTGAHPWRELGTIQPRPGQQFFLSSKAGKEEAIRNHLMIYMGNKCNLFSCDNLESKHQPPALTGDSSGCAFSTSHPVFLDMSLLKCSCHNHPHLLLTLLDQMPLTTSISRWKMMNAQVPRRKHKLQPVLSWQSENREEVFHRMLKTLGKTCYKNANFWSAEFSSASSTLAMLYLYAAI